MPDTAISTQVHQSLNIHRNFATKIPLHGKCRNCGTQSLDFRFAEILDDMSGLGIDYDGAGRYVDHEILALAARTLAATSMTS